MTVVDGVAQRLESDRHKFPGLLPDEVLVLRAWLTINERGFDRFDYNLRLGPEQDPGPNYTPDVRRCAILIHQMRLDAVGWRGVQNDLLPGATTKAADVYHLFPSAAATIVECKRRATPSAVGQIISYRDTWMHENPSAPRPDLVIVCNTYTPNIVPALTQNRIQLNTVKADFSILRNVKR